MSGIAKHLSYGCVATSKPAGIEGINMAEHFDAIVVGIGTMGAATCYQLARRGLRVLGLEQFGIPHAMGAHHGHSRMIRLAYFEHPDYVPLLARAYEAWRELEEQSGQRLLHVTGGIYMGPEGSELVEGALRSCQHHQLKHDLLNRHELQRRFPQFVTPAGYHGLYEDQAGFVLPEMAVTAYARLALLAGAQLRGYEPASDWQADGKKMTVTTTRGNYSCDRIIFTAGAWTRKLLASLKIPLRVTRQTLGWFWPQKPAEFSLGKFPVWFMETENSHGHYGFPMFSESLGFKLGLHKPAEAVDPDCVDRTFQEDDVAGLRQFLEAHIPSAAGPLLSASVCLYTVSPDSHFILDQLPSDSRVTWASGFSGHGFKFAGVIGEALADLATQGRSSLPIDFLRASRFGEVE
jgi:sarcosine oxidase